MSKRVKNYIEKDLAKRFADVDGVAVINPRGRPGFAKLSWFTNSLFQMESASISLPASTAPVSLQFVLLGLETNRVYGYNLVVWNDFNYTSQGGFMSTYPPALAGAESAVAP